MKHNHTILLVLSLFTLAAVLLSACGPAATPTPTKGPVTLTVTGQVNTELQLTDADLHAMTAVTLTLEHPKNGSTEYTGVRLNDLLNQAGIKAGAATVTFTASDGFTNDLDLATVQACTDCLVAFDPATPGVYNLAMPGQTSGKAWVNQLVSITIK
jgi:DMSO/TMAO reductase YedYZ molybdopterin-dependent catalytic subunit